MNFYSNKRNIILIFSLLLSSLTYAVNVNKVNKIFAKTYNINISDSSKTNNISIEDDIKIYKSKINEVEKRIKRDEPKLDSLENIVSELKDSLDTVKVRCKAEKKSFENTDRILISTTSTFLYMPYEKEYVNNFAIKAYEYVIDSDLEEKYKIRCELLKNYEKDLIDFYKFIRQEKKAVNNPFYQGGKSKQNLKSQAFFKRYVEYEDWENTYLGNMIKDFNDMLKRIDTTHYRFNADKILKELERVLKKNNIKVELQETVRAKESNKTPKSTQTIVNNPGHK